MAHRINYFLTKVFDTLLAPFSGVNDFWPVLILSVIMSFVILYILKFISFPKKIVDAKDKIKANIFAIRIYRDFWKVIVASFFKSLYHTFRYFVFNLAPFLVIIPLLLPVFSQMEARFGIRPFTPGETILLKARLDLNPRDHTIGIMENSLVRPKMRPVFISAWADEDKTRPVREANWKLEAVKEGRGSIGIKIDGREYKKSIVIGDAGDALSNRKYRDSGLNHFLYPAEERIADNEVLSSFIISYPGKMVRFLGISMHWILWNVFIVVVLILAFRKRFGVEF